MHRYLFTTPERNPINSCWSPTSEFYLHHPPTSILSSITTSTRKMAPSTKDTKNIIKDTAPTPSNQNNENGGNSNSSSQSSGKKSLKETVEADPTKIGDPVSVQVGENESPVGGSLENEQAGVKKDNKDSKL
jgi:hypothetical protein